MSKINRVIYLFLVVMTLNTTIYSAEFKKDTGKLEINKMFPNTRKVDYLERQLKSDRKAYVKGENTPFTGVFYLIVGDYLEYIETYKNGVLSGDKIWYDPNGNIMMIETYKDGRLHGEQVTYYPNNQKRSVVSYSNGRRLKAEWWSKSGAQLFKEVYNDGTGKWKHFYDNGSLHEEGEFLNNRRHGKWRTYSPKGEIERTVIYRNGVVESRRWME